MLWSTLGQSGPNLSQVGAEPHLPKLQSALWQTTHCLEGFSVIKNCCQGSIKISGSGSLLSHHFGHKHVRLKSESSVSVSLNEGVDSANLQIYVYEICGFSVEEYPRAASLQISTLTRILPVSPKKEANPQAFHTTARSTARYLQKSKVSEKW